MKKALTLMVVLAAVVPTMAGIDLFWSTTGMSDALKFSTELTNFLPGFVAPTPVTEVAWTGDPGAYDPGNPATYQDLFLWGKFNLQPDPGQPDYLPYYAQIYGLDLKFGGAAVREESVSYRHNKTPPPPTWRRWDGSQAILLDGVMAAVTSKGIQFYDPSTSNPDIYLNATGEFLIGAVRVKGANLQDQLEMSLDDVPPGLGIAVREYEGGPNIPDPTVTPGTVTFVPEPASMLLLALAGLLRRR